MRNTLCGSMVLAAAMLYAQEADTSADASADATNSDPAWLRLCKKGADQHVIRLRQTKEPLKRLEHPVLRHNQSIRDNQVGVLFLWKHEDGRPAVLCGSVVAPDNDRPGNHYFQQEFIALSDRALDTTLGPRGKQWLPKAGCDWVRIPNVTKTPKTKTQLSLQAKRILGELDAYGIDWRHDNQQRGYRLLPKPLYEYTVEEESSKEVIRGAVFAFCLAVDPEIIVQVEARTKDGKTEWYRAFSPFSDMATVVTQKDKQVWKVPPNTWGSRHTATMQLYVKLDDGSI